MSCRHSRLAFAVTLALLVTTSPLMAHAEEPAVPVRGEVPDRALPAVPVHLVGADGLHVEMQPLRLEPHDDDEVDDDAWRNVCNAPCDRLLPTGGVYRIAGPGTADSDELHLHPSGDQPIILNVKPNSNVRRRTGTGLIVGGSIVLGVGTSITLLDLLVSAVLGSNAANAALGVGLGGDVAGGAMLAVGLTIHAPTRVWQETTAAAAPSPPPTDAPVAPASSLRLPSTSTTPLFTAVF